MMRPGCRLNVVATRAFATLGVVALMLANNQAHLGEALPTKTSSDGDNFENNSTLSGSGRSREQINRLAIFYRGGRVLEHPYDLLNKWVVILRKRQPDLPIPVEGSKEDIGFMSLGYGLFYRKDGWMLANLEGMLKGGERMEEERRNVSGWYVHEKEFDNYRYDHDKNKVGHQVTTFIADHAISFAGPNVGVFRTFIYDYDDYFRVPPNGWPAFQVVYPMEAWLPQLATKNDQRISCYVIIHDHFFDDPDVGPQYGQYNWRFWAVKRIGQCKGPVCKFGPHPEREKVDLPITYKTQYHAPGQICNRIQDRGAPILCHNQDKLWNLESNYGRPRLDEDYGRAWKLAYTIIKPIPKPGWPELAECSNEFTAFDLSQHSNILYDDYLDKLIPDHYDSDINPSE